MQSVRFGNGVDIELQQSGDQFMGLGAVVCGTTPLRSGRLPMFVDIRSPYGIELCDYRLLKREELEGGTRLIFSMKRREGGPLEWQLHECRRLYNTTDWTRTLRPAEDTELILDLKEVNRQIGKDRYAGFSYQYRYRSASVPIYTILDRGSWEPGGRAIGNEFWMRNCFCPPVYRAKDVAEHFSTEWFLADITNPNIVQFLPLQTELQGFSFTAAEAGILVTWATRVAHVRSLFEKPRGQNEFVHLHEHSGDLGIEFVTSPVEVLFSAGPRDAAGRVNAYGAMAELVHETLHAQLGMRRERITTYAQIEEWGDADLDLYRTEGLPKLLEAGTRTVYVANHFENNMNTYGLSNFCCTVDYKVAETVGEDKLTAFCQTAREGGAKVEMWANTSLSTLTWMQRMRNGRPKRIQFLPLEDSVMEAFEKAKAPFVRTTFGSIEADHYTPQFAVMNLRDPVVREYWMKRWTYAHDTIGLEGIFLDSSFNLSSDKFHYAYNAEPGRKSGATADQTDLLGGMRPARAPAAQILSQYRAHLDLMVEMQQAGYVYCNEDLGVFGIHRHGPGVAKRLATLWMWTDCVCGFDARGIRAAGGDPDEVFFRGLAYRMMWCLHWHVPSRTLTFNYNGARDGEDLPSDWHLALWKAFSATADWMVEREVLPGEHGVVYRSGGREVVWAFADITVPLRGRKTVKDVLSGTTVTTDRLQAAKHHVYLAE